MVYFFQLLYVLYTAMCTVCCYVYCMLLCALYSVMCAVSADVLLQLADVLLQLDDVKVMTVCIYWDYNVCGNVYMVRASFGDYSGNYICGVELR